MGVKQELGPEGTLLNKERGVSQSRKKRNWGKW